eukprot:XP_001691787.1 phosphate acetyltransferase [Chlamydomonas reinhardtii]
MAFASSSMAALSRPLAAVSSGLGSALSRASQLLTSGSLSSSPTASHSSTRRFISDGTVGSKGRPDSLFLSDISGRPNATANDYYNKAMVKRQVFADHKVDVLGVVINGLPREHHAILSSQLRDKLERAGLPFAGALPEDPVLSSVRPPPPALDKPSPGLTCVSSCAPSHRYPPTLPPLGLGLLLCPCPVPARLQLIASGKQSEVLDRIYAAYMAYKAGGELDLCLVEGPGPLMGGTELDAQVVVGSQRLEELLETLVERPMGRPLVVTSADRLDIVLGLLAAQLSVRGPSVAGVLLTQAGASRITRSYAKSAVDNIFAGLSNNTGASGGGPDGAAAANGSAQGSLYRGALLPVLSTDKHLAEALAVIGRMDASILPTSIRKVTQCKVAGAAVMLFDKYIDANAVVTGLQKSRPTRVTPKMFQHTMKAMCRASPQHIVLPESVDKRVLAAAADVTARGLARVTLLGDPTTVQQEPPPSPSTPAAMAAPASASSDRFDKYVDMLVEARKKKGMTREAAADTLHGDINFFGTMMVAAGDADGMVSGAIHTTASTIRPALQMLKNPASSLVSSIFFMCLPDRVLVYGDCAVNVSPSAADLAAIATTSADTAAAFGIEPRVAMLSYSTLGSGAGPDVQKVTEAVALVKQQRQDIKVEGPIQYDAAIDPAVAAVKVKGGSEVAGRATVFVFPDLNTGNNTYKAVQQSTGAIAMGPVMQVCVRVSAGVGGLLKPVNDLSRGCTVPDIVNTICVTSIQAMQFKQRTQAAVAAAAAPK